MEYPQVRQLLKSGRHAWLRLSHQHRGPSLLAGLALLLTLLLILIQFYRILFPDVSVAATIRSRLPSADVPTLFIAIGSAPNNTLLRKAARETWLQWLPQDGSVSYRFFTDSPPSIKSSGNELPEVWRTIVHESRLHNDLIFQPLGSGYGTNEHNKYGERALYQLHWNSRHASMDHFLRVDDDSFLCLHRLLYELKSAPREQFFWGKFWCREGRNRADENFMLFSRDVADLLANEELVGKVLPFDKEVTLGWNFGYWSWVLNLTIFDDQKRIDAQQGYLTKYMHGKEGFEKASEFCERFIYAHHVTPEAMHAAFKSAAPHLMYSIPQRTSPAETCKLNTQSFVPGRHSAVLPHVKITRSGNNGGES